MRFNQARSGLCILLFFSVSVSASAQVVKNAKDCPSNTTAVQQCGGADNRASCWYRCAPKAAATGGGGCIHGTVAPKGGYKKKFSSTISNTCPK